MPVFWFAAAVLAKASGLVFGPICLFIVELERLARAGKLQDTWPTGWRGRLGHLWALLLPWRRDWLLHRPGWNGIGVSLLRQRFQTGAVLRGSAQRCRKESRTPMVWLSDHLCIFAIAGEGLVRQIKHNLHGHSTYLLGQGDARSFWYYFPVLLTIKLTLPVLGPVGGGAAATAQPAEYRLSLRRCADCGEFEFSACKSAFA